MELDELKAKFHDMTAAMYPYNSEMCWLFDTALGIDPRTVAAEPITKKTYRVHILDEKGNKTVRNGDVLLVTRKFDPKQAKVVREWWPILPDRFKDE